MLTATGHAGTLVVLRALGLGDLLAAIPALRGLARAFPDHRRVLLTPRTLEPLARWSGAVHDVVHADGVTGLGPLPAAAQDADVAVNLHGRGPQSHRALLARAPHRLLAFRHDTAWSHPGAPDWRPGEPERHRWARMLAAFAVSSDPDDLDVVVPPANRRRVPHPVRGATVVHAGAASAARCWPLARWAEVVLHEQRCGRTVVLTGSAGDRNRTRALRRATGPPPAHDLAGRTDVADLAALVSTAGRVVCGDTGVAHLATAVGTPSVVLFGPTSPVEWGPPPSRTIHRVLWAGRRGDPHGREVDPGLLAIGVDEVLDALDGVPERQAVARSAGD